MKDLHKIETSVVFTVVGIILLFRDLILSYGRKIQLDYQ